MVGEGLDSRELLWNTDLKGFSPQDYSYHQKMMGDPNFSLEFFRANPKEPAYTALKFLFPERIRLYGADDQDIKQIGKKILQEMFAVAQEYLSLPITPYKLHAYEMAVAPINAKYAAHNDRRSQLHLQRAISLTNSSQQDVAIVIGARHIPTMRESYQGNRRMYILTPKVTQ